MTQAKLYRKFLETIPTDKLSEEAQLELAEVELFELEQENKVNGDIKEEDEDDE